MMMKALENSEDDEVTTSSCRSSKSSSAATRKQMGKMEKDTKKMFVTHSAQLKELKEQQDDNDSVGSGFTMCQMGATLR
jgi:hypothetical protein